LFVLSQLSARQWSHQRKMTQLALLICILMVVLPFLQLVPLPPWLWKSLPGRAPLTQAFDLLGRAVPWRPISVSPNATWVSLLSMLPPIALFLGVVQLGLSERRKLSLVFVAFGGVSALMGILQVAQGPSSPLRFFDFTNLTEAVGFFANRNHFAALIYSSLLVAAAWTTTQAASAAGSWQDRKNLQTSSIALLTVGFVGIVLFIAAEFMTRSRAGLGFTILALVGASVLGLSDRRISSGITPRKLVIGATLLAVMFSVQFALYRFMERFTDDPMDDARIPFARNTIAAATTFMPTGSGIGTFVPVYAGFEKASDISGNVYANHAHNDLLELWLETGIAGLLLLGLFVLWFVWTSMRVWRDKGSTTRDIDRCMARAATLIIGFLLVHSLVDYPLRTDAMMAVFAFSCALLVEPMGQRAGRESIADAIPQSADVRKRPPLPDPPARPRTAPPAPRAPVLDSVKLPVAARGRWGEDVAWPQQWLQNETKAPKPVRDEEKGSSE
jgi:O-antigen ligase